ncbi:hypothetical protein GCK32_012548, partial [Trichostrongylus colubriformis]
MASLKCPMAVTSDGPSQLFVGSLPVTLLQPNKNGPEYMSTVAEVALKIAERRLDNGEKEYRMEISRPDDFEFLYAEGITRAKYQTLAKTWNLNVDFDDFPARIVRLLRERTGSASPVQLTCTLSQDLSICTFEVVHVIDMYTVRMPIELRAVRDKDLLCHIINNMRSLQKQLCKVKTEKKQVESERDELKCMVNDLKEFRSKAEQRMAELEQRLKDAEKRAADETLRREEFEQDLQLERDERDSALGTIEHLKDELAEAEKKARELEEELDQCEEECEELEEKLRDSELSCSRLRGDKEKLVIALDKAKKDLSKANHVISKYLKGELRSPSDRSLDERKDELAADLKVKESLIDEMTASIADYKKKVDDLTKENKELQETLQVMEVERSRSARVIEMYRNQSRIGPTYPAGISPPIFHGPGTTTLLSGRTSPLLGCAPT